MCLWERRVRIGRETKIEVKIQSDRKNHTGHDRHRRSRGRRGVRTFTQYFPAVPTATPTANLVPNCGTSTPGDVLTFTPATVVAGQPFAIVYSCTSGPAITVTNGPITKITTEAQAIGAGGMPTTHSLIATGDICTSTAGIALAQSTAVSIPTGSYNYCATGTSAAVTGVVSFTVAWA